MSANFTRAINYQPASSMSKWASRGCNVAYGYENEGGGVSYATWKAAVSSAGMKYIPQWLDRNTRLPYLTSADDHDPNLLGIAMPDEPDAAGNVTPGQIIDMCIAARAVCPSKPIWLNLDGFKTQWRPFNDYVCYAYGVDYLGFDYYPINRGNLPNDTAAGIPFIGDRIDFCARACAAAGGAKKTFAFIECSHQHLELQSWLFGHTPVPRGPTGAEMAQEVQVVLNHGAQAILWFPECIGAGFCGFDGMNADQISSMTSINAMLAAR